MKNVTTIIATILSLYSISFLVYGGSSSGAANFTAYAQLDLQTIKYRDMVIDLGNGVQTDAQLTYPAVGNGPFPGVLLIHGTGANDKNETVGFVYNDGPEPAKLFWQIAEYLSDRGFAVLRYDKRGVGANYTILDQNVWGNTTTNDLTQDSTKALNVLIQQPEVDPKEISVIAISEGTLYAPRVAIDNPTKVKNIVLMGIIAQNVSVSDYYQEVTLPLEYASQVLDKNHTGLISIQQIANDPMLRNVLVSSSSVLGTNNTEDITNDLVERFGTTGNVSIQEQIRPAFINYYYENTTAFNLEDKCTSLGVCPILYKSIYSLTPNLSIIGNVSNSTGILMLVGENDTQTPVQQAFLLQQRLTEVNHPDHTLITYPNLGHSFSPSSQWLTTFGPIEQYVLADLYAWLAAHSGFTHTPTSIPSSNSSSSNSTTR